MKTRWWWVTIVISLVVAVGAFGVGLSLGEDPPVDPDAVPEPVLATVALEVRLLSEDVVVRADVVAKDTTSIEPPAIPSGRAPVVTSVEILPGGSVEPGRLLLTVADRPVIALTGAVPMYRDIRPQDVGSDVLQLQRALISLGFELEEDGVFGRDTEAAVRDLYSRLGLTMLHTGGQDQVDALEQELANARLGGSSADITRARARLNGFAATVGNYIARGEIAFLGSLPVKVLTAPSPGKIWDGADEAVGLTVTGSELGLVGLVADEVESLVRVGTLGNVELPDGELVEVMVVSIDPDPVVDEAGVRFRVSLEPAEPLDLALIGQNLKLALFADGPSGEVLAAPISAVYTSSDGQTYLMRPDGARIVVELGSVSGGWVEIANGEIDAGAEVVVGLEE